MIKFRISYTRSKGRFGRVFCGVLGFCAALTGQAATLIVDNDVTHAGGHFQSIQEAVNAAAPGDTIMVMPSQLQYGRATIQKSLTIMGPGWGGRSVAGPFQDMNARVGGFSIMGGASNITITGLEVTASITFSGARQIPDPSGDRAFITEPGSSVVSDVLITRNWLSADKEALKLIDPYSDSVLKRLLLVNNYISEPLSSIAFGGNAWISRWSTEIFILNNRIHGALKLSKGGDGTGPTLITQSDVQNYAVVEGNILTGRIELGAGIFRNNVVRITAMLNNASTVSRNVFVDQFPEAYDSYNSGGRQLIPPYLPDENLLAPSIEDVLVWKGGLWRSWELTENSPARGYATDGGDVGLFGGLHPWDREQMPPIPYISEFRAPVVVNQGSPIRVQVEVKLND